MGNTNVTPLTQDLSPKTRKSVGRGQFCVCPAPIERGCNQHCLICKSCCVDLGCGCCCCCIHEAEMLEDEFMIIAHETNKTAVSDAPTEMPSSPPLRQGTEGVLIWIDENEGLRDKRGEMDAFMQDYLEGRPVMLVRDNGNCIGAIMTLTKDMKELRLNINRKELTIPIIHIEHVLNVGPTEVNKAHFSGTSASLVWHQTDPSTEKDEKPVVTIQLIGGGFVTIRFNLQDEQTRFVEFVRILQKYNNDIYGAG
eukprot:Filipodium_phascolosomae@DN5975_c0_g1_i1.p1